MSQTMDVDKPPVAQQIAEQISDQELLSCLESSPLIQEFKSWKPLGQYLADITIDQLHQDFLGNNAKFGFDELSRVQDHTNISKTQWKNN